MNTYQIMEKALVLANLDSIPEDSAIINETDKVDSILFGIDIDEADLKNAKQNGYDTVISHHPFDDTLFISMMYRHEQLMIDYGVEPRLAHLAKKEAMLPYQNWAKGLPANNQIKKMAAVAKRLNIGLMNIHNPSDELGRQLLCNSIDRIGQDGTVLQLMKSYQLIPEMKQSEENIELICGSKNAKIGKTAVIHLVSIL